MITAGHSGHAFAYWTGEDREKIESFREHWQSSFSNFRIFGDQDVLPLLKKHLAAKHLELYQQISIPAAKSDIARLVLLYEYGGLYIDCHCGMVETDEISRLLSELGRYEGVLIDRRRWQEPRHREEYYLVNSIMFARQGSKLFYSFLLKALYNLECQRELEIWMNGYSPYHIGTITGPVVLNEVALQPMSRNRKIRLDYEKRLKVIPEETAPVERDVFRSYNEGGRHWSMVQLDQKLFLSR